MGQERRAVPRRACEAFIRIAAAAVVVTVASLILTAPRAPAATLRHPDSVAVPVPPAGLAEPLWSFSDGSTEVFEASDAGTDFFAFANGDIVAIAESTGEMRWRSNVAPTDWPGPGGLVAADGYLAVTSGAGFGATVDVFDDQTGQELWSATSGDWCPDGDSASDGVLYLTSACYFDDDPPQALYALDEVTGHLIWTYSGHIIVSGPFAIGDTVLVTGCLAGYCEEPLVTVALSGRSGATQWIDNGLDIGTVVPGTGANTGPFGTGTVYVLDSERDEICALSLTTGATGWSTPADPYTRVLVAADAILFVAPYGQQQVQALSEATGLVRWATPGPMIGVDDGLVYGAGVAGRPEGSDAVYEPVGVTVGVYEPDSVTVVDADSGRSLGSFAVAGGSGVLWAVGLGVGFGSPSFSLDGGVLIGIDENEVTAFALPTSDFTPPVTAMAATPDGGGYWEVAQDGGVFAFGDARYYGSLPGIRVSVDDITGIAGTADGRGYWLVGEDGGVFAFGDARYQGSLPGRGLRVDDVVGITPDPGGQGYWLVGADGGVFALGGAAFLGSADFSDLSASSLSPTSDGRGYWVFGYFGVEAFGTATQLDSPGGISQVFRPGGGIWGTGQNAVVTGVNGAPSWLVPAVADVGDIRAIVPTPDGGGYWLLGTDGGVFGFGDAHFYGSRG